MIELVSMFDVDTIGLRRLLIEILEHDIVEHDIVVDVINGHVIVSTTKFELNVPPVPPVPPVPEPLKT